MANGDLLHCFVEVECPLNREEKSLGIVVGTVHNIPELLTVYMLTNGGVTIVIAKEKCSLVEKPNVPDDLLDLYKNNLARMLPRETLQSLFARY